MDGTIRKSVTMVEIREERGEGGSKWSAERRGDPTHIVVDRRPYKEGQFFPFSFRESRLSSLPEKSVLYRSEVVADYEGCPVSTFVYGTFSTPSTIDHVKGGGKERERERERGREGHSPPFLWRNSRSGSNQGVWQTQWRGEGEGGRQGKALLSRSFM